VIGNVKITRIGRTNVLTMPAIWHARADQGLSTQTAAGTR
jgi:hypothetical protein